MNPLYEQSASGFVEMINEIISNRLIAGLYFMLFIRYPLPANCNFISASSGFRNTNHSNSTTHFLLL